MSHSANTAKPVRQAAELRVQTSGIQNRIDRGAKYLRSNLTAYLMLAPMVILLSIFVLYPLGYSFYLSVFEVSFYRDFEFVGLQYYRFVLTEPKFWNAVWVGVRYAIYVVPVMMVLSFLLASFIRIVSVKIAGLLKTTVYIPTVVSGVIVSIIFGFMYRMDGGIINWLLALVGIGPYTFLSDPKLALPALSAAGIWLSFGITTLIMTAAIFDIPESYYEAAQLEGANYFQRARYITIPLMKNITLYLFVTGILGALQQYELSLVMTGGGPLSATTTPNLYIFQSFTSPGAYSTSFSLAAALVMFFVLGSVSVLIFRFIKSEKAIDG